MRIAFTDAETLQLNADFGHLLCACVGEYDSHPKHNPWRNIQTFTLDDWAQRWDDRGLAKRWRDSLEEYDAIVTWNGIKFDIPFLETRCRRWNLRGPRITSHKDLVYTSRYKLRLSSNALESVSSHLQIHDKYGIDKTRLKPEEWAKAAGGRQDSYRYIVHHCQLDVKVLAAVYHELRHLFPIFQKV